MSRKLVTALAPVLATAAFVVMPTMAQAATPHYYVAGVKAKEGTTFPSISWGTLTLANENPSISPFSCENAAIGNYKNPTGGGPGEAETDDFATTDCADVECPEEEGLEFQIRSEGLPWEGGLLGTETGKDLLEIKNAITVMGCYVAHTSTLVAAPTTCKGNSDPALTNGTGNLSQTVSTILFTGQTDKLECVAMTESDEVKTEGITEKALKTMAYGSPVPTKKVEPETANTAQATLETRNP